MKKRGCEIAVFVEDVQDHVQIADYLNQNHVMPLDAEMLGCYVKAYADQVFQRPHISTMNEARVFVSAINAVEALAA